MIDCCLRPRENKFQINYNQNNWCFDENYTNNKSLLQNAKIKTRPEEFYVDQLHSFGAYDGTKN